MLVFVIEMTAWAVHIFSLTWDISCNVDLPFENDRLILNEPYAQCTLRSGSAYAPYTFTQPAFETLRKKIKIEKSTWKALTNWISVSFSMNLSGFPKWLMKRTKIKRRGHASISCRHIRIALMWTHKNYNWQENEFESEYTNEKCQNKQKRRKNLQQQQQNR